MQNLSAMGIGGGKPYVLALTENFFVSRTWVAPADGVVVFRAMGAGGGGARTTGASVTGGYSASWGMKTLKVKKGDTVSFSIGAGGPGGTAGAGSAGGNAVVVVDGVSYIAYGGPGGLLNAAATPVDGPMPSANWDVRVASVKPGWAAGTIRTGGAGVDILGKGNNATTSAAVDFSGGGGTGAASTSTAGGGAVGSAAADGDATPSKFFDAGNGDWGISFYGGSGGGAGSANGANGGGGLGATSSPGVGGFGGGGGGGSSIGAAGGLGGGGGASNNVSGGPGGNAYGHLKFFMEIK